MSQRRRVESMLIEDIEKQKKINNLPGIARHYKEILNRSAISGKILEEDIGWCEKHEDEIDTLKEKGEI